MPKPISQNEFFNSKTGCSKLLQNIIKFGLGMVNGVEATASATENLLEQIAPQMDSIFGKTSVISSEHMKHEDLAYTHVELEAHNDNTYWNDAAGYFCMFCFTELSYSYTVIDWRLFTFYSMMGLEVKHFWLTVSMPRIN